MSNVNIPASCPACGCIIGSGMVIGSGVYNATYARGATTCHCGATARVVEGTFANDEGQLTGAGRTALDRAVIARVGLLVQDLLSQGASVEAIKDRVREVAPEVVSQLPARRKDLKRWARGAAALAVGTVLTLGVTDGYNWVKKQVVAEQAEPFTPPEDSSGYVRLRDGSTMRWREGTRPTDRKPGP